MDLINKKKSKTISECNKQIKCIYFEYLNHVNY